MIAYEYLGKDDNYFIGWNDKVDDHEEFDHIVCKFYDGPIPDELNLTVTLRIYLTTSCLTIQGGGYIWFIEQISREFRPHSNHYLLNLIQILHSTDGDKEETAKTTSTTNTSTNLPYQST